MEGSAAAGTGSAQQGETGWLIPVPVAPEPRVSSLVVVTPYSFPPGPSNSSLVRPDTDWGNAARCRFFPGITGTSLISDSKWSFPKASTILGCAANQVSGKGLGALCLLTWSSTRPMSYVLLGMEQRVSPALAWAGGSQAGSTPVPTIPRPTWPPCSCLIPPARRAPDTDPWRRCCQRLKTTRSGLCCADEELSGGRGAEEPAVNPGLFDPFFLLMAPASQGYHVLSACR